MPGILERVVAEGNPGRSREQTERRGLPAGRARRNLEKKSFLSRMQWGGWRKTFPQNFQGKSTSLPNAFSESGHFLGNVQRCGVLHRSEQGWDSVCAGGPA